jgi:transposase
MRAGISITLQPAVRRRLMALARDRNAAHKQVWRAEIVLLSAAGVGTNEIMRRTGKSKTCVWRWQERFMQEGYEGLLRDKTRPSRIPALKPNVAERVVALSQTEPPAEATHWTAAMMAKAVDISASSVHRIWHEHGLQPHRVKQFKLSTDPRFIAKLRDIVGLYVDPPAHTVVLSVDEKSQIQALDRTQPGLPMKPGRAGTMTHDYKRHARRRCSPLSMSSTAPSLAATCNVIATRSSSASSTPSRPRCRGERRSMPSSATTPPTSIQKCGNGSPAIHAGASTSPQHRRPGSTPSKASSRSSHGDGSNVASFVPQRPSGRHQPLRRRNQQRPKAVRLDRRSKEDHRCRQKRVPSVRFAPLVVTLDETARHDLSGIAQQHVRAPCRAQVRAAGLSASSGRAAILPEARSTPRWRDRVAWRGTPIRRGHALS